MRAAALRTGQVINQAEIARDIAISRPTAHRYLSSFPPDGADGDVGASFGEFVSAMRVWPGLDLLGGLLPLHLCTGRLGKPSVVVPIANHDNN